MKKVNRRNFIKKGIQGTAIITGGLTMGNLNALAGKQTDRSGSFTAVIPMPIQVVIDDVGWWSGKDGSKYQEPYRTGIDRNHVPADYEAIVKLGKALGIRPQAATVLGEWDRKNILRNVPHSNWMGAQWDNSKWVGPWMEEAADIINSNREHFEITLHGLCHEWWTDGKFTRAEWADNDGIMRPKEDVERHLDAFAEIMHQNRLGELPVSFVPTAFRHGFGVTPGNTVSIAEILRKRGFTYINTPYVIMRNKEQVQYDVFGIDSGVITVDRGMDLLDWDNIGLVPSGEIKGPTCGMHWPNLLHEDPERNEEIVENWINLLAPYDEKPDRMLAKNPVVFQKQLVHYKATKIERKGNTIALDFSDTDKVGNLLPNDEMVLKVKSPEKLKFSSETIKIQRTSLIRDNNNIIYTINLKRGKNKKALITIEAAS